MNPVLRATAILIDPFAEWARIEKEPSADSIYLMTRYIAPLALVPAVFGFIGACVIGATAPAMGVVRAPLFVGLFGAVFGYLESLAAMLLLGLFIEHLAPSFGGGKDFSRALRLAAYSSTPVWLAGIFLLLPGLRFLMLTGFYGAYILVAGLPTLKLPARKSAAFAAFVVACACALALIVRAAQQMLFPGAGGM